jgi:hypothetical protein
VEWRAWGGGLEEGEEDEDPAVEATRGVNTCPLTINIGARTHKLGLSLGVEVERLWAYLSPPIDMNESVSVMNESG